MKIASITQLPTSARGFFTTVKTLLAQATRKEAARADVVTELNTFMGEEKSVLVVTKHGLALFDVNPQAKPEIKEGEMEAPEVKALLEAQQAVKDASAKASAAYQVAKNAGKIITKTAPPTPRLEILNADKTAEMLAKYPTQIRSIRRGEVSEVVVA